MQPNYILEAAPGTFPAKSKDITPSMQRTSKAETSKIADLSRKLTGSDMMPKLLYKGRVIPAGKLGTRKLSVA